MKLERNTPI